ncbi:MAG: hypothetical protein H8E38_12645 [SAR324 cluster bacterium]|nr:hypothetical protein [SAR324 cluster bacterium]MBL7035327.1 hypothetical protein [SAR324 cluster bacterium]
MDIWRLIEDIPRSGSFNMAADQVLLDNYSQNDDPVLRLYDWECSTLSLGRNEKIDRRIDLKACNELAIPVVRRATGGKAVLHGDDLTYSVVGGVLDQQFSGGVLDNYRYLVQGFKLFFQTLDLAPELQEQTQQKSNNDNHICFADPAVYEILIEGRKIIGNAQRVRTIHGSDSSSCRVFLQHGTIPLRDPIPQILNIFPYTQENRLRQEMHSMETAGVYPGRSSQDLRLLLLDCLGEAFKVKWNRQCWSEDELNLIAESESLFQQL